MEEALGCFYSLSFLWHVFEYLVLTSIAGDSWETNGFCQALFPNCPLDSFLLLLILTTGAQFRSQLTLLPFSGQRTAEQQIYVFKIHQHSNFSGNANARWGTS